MFNLSFNENDEVKNGQYFNNNNSFSNDKK